MSEVLGFLTRMRYRAQLRLGAMAAIWLGAAALALLGIRLLETGWSGASPAPWWPTARISIVSLLLSVPLVLVVRATFLRPPLAEVASRLDRRFRLQDRLQTVVEVSTAGPSTVAEHLVLHDAARWVARLRSQQVAGVGQMRGAASWAAACSLLAVAVCVVAIVSGQAPQAVDGPALASPVDVVDASLALADLLADDPRFEGDPYIEAVARSFEQFAASARNATSIDGEREAELAELLSHLYAALEGRDPATREALRSTLTDLADLTDTTPGVRADLSASPPRSGTQLPAPTSVTELGRSVPPTGEEPVAARGLEVGADRLQEALAAAVQSLQGAREAREGRQGPGRAAVHSDIEDTYEFLSPEMLASIELAKGSDEAAFETAAAGVTVGAAKEANDGGGNQAGDGTQPLFGEAVPTPEMAEGGPDLLLPEGEGEEGTKRRAETRPVSTGEVGAMPVSVEPVVWEPLHQAQLSEAVTIGLRHRALISRYFMPGDR